MSQTPSSAHVQWLYEAASEAEEEDGSSSQGQLRAMSALDSLHLEHLLHKHAGIGHTAPILLGLPAPAAAAAATSMAPPAFYQQNYGRFVLVRRGELLYQVRISDMAATRLSRVQRSLQPLLDRLGRLKHHQGHHQHHQQEQSQPSAAHNPSAHNHDDEEVCLMEVDSEAAEASSGAVAAASAASASGGQVIPLPGPHDPALIALKAAMLHPVLRPAPLQSAELTEQEPEPDWARVEALCRQLAPQQSSLVNVTGGQPVLQLLRATLHQGLPNFRATPQLHLTACYGLRLCFNKFLATPSPVSEERQRIQVATLLQALADCQQQQFMAICSMVSAATGHQKTFTEHIKALINTEKDRVLDLMASVLEPEYACHDLPQTQAPHIRSGLVAALDGDFGLSNVTAALADAHRPKFTDAEELKQLRHVFTELFDPLFVVHALINDINKTNEFTDHLRDEYVPLTWHVLSDFFQILEISPVPQRQALASQIKEQLIFDPEQKYTHVIADQHEGIATTPATTMRLIALALDLLGVPFTAAQWRSIVA